MTEHIYELSVDGLAEAYEEFTAQTNVVEDARKQVEQLREGDTISPYTSIDSDAGRAEINYNIQRAHLLTVVDYYTDIQIWSSKYVEWFRQFGTGRDSNTYKTFREFYTDINKIYLNSMLSNYVFTCKCLDSVEHSFICGNSVCAMGTKVTLVNIETAYNTLGYIGYNYPHLIYPIEC